MATTGSLNTSGYEGRYLQLTWSRQSYDIASNPATSTIAWELRGAGSAPSSWYYAGPFTVVIDGQTVYQSSSRLQLYDGTLVASGTLTIAHAADGTRSFDASVSAAIYASSPNVSGSGSWALDALPRASTLSFGTVVLGSPLDITISSASGTFTHTLTYVFGGVSGTIATGAGTSASWTPPLSLAAQIPNSTSGNGTITCTTYSGGSVVGTTSYPFTAYLPESVVPIINSCTVSPVNGNAWLTPKGLYVSTGYSRARVVTDAAGISGSTVKSITISGGIGTGSGPNWTSEPLTAGTKTITVTVTDSRGRTASVTRSITVLSYYAPYISNPVCERGTYSGGVWTTNTSGLDARISFSVGPALADYGNLLTVSVAVDGQTTQTSASVPASNKIYYFAGIGSDVTRTVSITATDSVGSVSTRSAVIPTVEVACNYNPTIRGICVGGVATKAKTLECKWPAEFGGGIKMGNVDLDYIVEQGTSGIWAYRKWANGAVECWGKWSGSLTHYATYLGGYGYATLVALPFTFIEPPVYTYIGKVGSSGAGIPASFYSDKSQVQIVLLSTLSGSQSVMANLTVDGRWK